MATNNAVNVTLSGQTGTGTFVGSTSPTITTPVIAQINDSSGNEQLIFTAAASAVNYLEILNSSTGNPVRIKSSGDDASIQIGFYSKGGQIIYSDYTATNSAKTYWYNAATTHYTSLTVATAQAANLELTLPGVDGAANALMQTSGAGVLSFTATPSVTSITLGGGTALANYLQGTWTPTVTLVGGAGNTVPVYTTNTGTYTRIGRMVFCNVILNGDGGAEGAGTGQVNIALPITAAASNSAVVYYPVGTGLNNATYYELYGQIATGGSTLILAYFNVLTSAIAFTGADQNNTSRAIQLRFFYEV